MLKVLIISTIQNEIVKSQVCERKSAYTKDKKEICQNGKMILSISEFFSLFFLEYHGLDLIVVCVLRGE